MKVDDQNLGHRSGEAFLVAEMRDAKGFKERNDRHSVQACEKSWYPWQFCIYPLICWTTVNIVSSDVDKIYEMGQIC